MNKYSVSIYRMGYYGGAGARLMRSLGPLQGTAEPTPPDGNRNLLECKWKVGFSLDIPADWLSGVCIGKLSTGSGAGWAVSGSRHAERGLLHFCRCGQSQGQPAADGIRHDLVVLQPLAAMAMGSASWEPTRGAHPTERLATTSDSTGPTRSTGTDSPPGFTR